MGVPNLLSFFYKFSSSINLTVPIDAILVPQGAEYGSVCRSLNRVTVPTPSVFPIPVGFKPLTRYLERWQQAGHLRESSQPKVLLMGLCGSLTPNYSIGEIVLYRDCVCKLDTGLQQLRNCDPELTTLLHHQLKDKAFLVKALTSDRLVSSAAEKRQLGQSYQAEVVDMEGFAALEVLTQAGVAVAMVRTISDDTHHDLPDLSSAISPDGLLEPLPLAIGMLRQPIAATRLIRGSLRGLKVLQAVTTSLFAK